MRILPNELRELLEIEQVSDRDIQRLGKIVQIVERW